MAEKLDNYLKHLKSENILSAIEKAKHKSLGMLEEQGITAVALYMSNLLTKSVREMEKLREA